MSHSSVLDRLRSATERVRQADHADGTGYHEQPDRDYYGLDDFIPKTDPDQPGPFGGINDWYESQPNATGDPHK
jgi:hypothetical protein